MNEDFGVTNEGFILKRLEEIKSSLEDGFISEFSDINLDAASVAGQLIGIFSKVYADYWEDSQDVYLSQYPNSASGISLDNAVQLNGLTRIPASRTTVIGVATGIEGTIIPAGGLARIPDAGDTFQVANTTVITRASSAQSIMQVITPLVAQAYTVLINGQSFTFVRPVIGFSGPIVASNTIDVRINNIQVPQITYATSSTATLNALGSAILVALPADVAAASVSGNELFLTPIVGRNIVVNSVNVAGPGSPTYVPSIGFPASSAQVAEHLSALLDQSTVVSSSWVPTTRQFTITTRNTRVPYALNFSSNLQALSVSSPVEYVALEYGPIAAPANSLTEILSPIAGFQSLNNFDAGNTGRFQETDAELRIRRARSLRSTGYATVEAIRSRLLQEVEGVLSVNIFENVTMVQSDSTITFSADFITGNSTQVVIDGNLLGTVNFATTSADMMNAINAIIQAYDEVATSTVTGANTIEVSFDSGQEVELEFFTTGGVSQPTYNIAGGLPPKSFEVIIEGGSDLDVAEKIWETKPAGIQTFGNTSVNITDSQGFTQVINFTRAIAKYISVNVEIVLNPQETFPSNGLSMIANSILAYGNSLGVGIDVFIQRVLAQVFLTPGVANAVVELGVSNNENEIPIVAANNIPIQYNEVSVWSINRINVSII